MIPVKRPDLDDPEWVAWRADARKAIESVQAQYKPGAAVAIKDELYKRAMPFLLRLFNDKCAYCEAVISSTQPGDVEHYRPKGRIKEIDGKIVKITVDGQLIDHPGYWWLSYEWTNLLPSCIDCNRRRRHGEDETPAGKAELFPIAGTRAVGPMDRLSAEEALLLNPTDEQFDPDQQFEFKQDGKIAPKTQQAKTSCDLLGLNLREKLVEQRATAYATASAEFSQFVTVSISALILGGPMNDNERKLRVRINDMWEGRTQYGAFARLALAAAKQALESRSIKITFPLPIN